MILRTIFFAVSLLLPTIFLHGGTPQRFKNAAVVSQSEMASQVGAKVLQEGGNAIDAAVATAFALAVTHPAAGNIGGGGFLVYRSSTGDAVTYDFRETAPAAANAEMWLDENGEYDYGKHHHSHLAVGVPGSVAGLHLAWKEQGRLPWKRLVTPAVQLAESGIVVSQGLADSLAEVTPRLKISQAAFRQFTNDGKTFVAGERLVQQDLAESLHRIAIDGSDGFYSGKTADLIVAEMNANGGLITHQDLRNYKPIRREPVRGMYREHEIIGMPPPSSGGVTMIMMLNMLEGFPIAKYGAGSADSLHVMSEAMRRAYRHRAQFLGDPDFNPMMPIEKLLSKDFAMELRQTIDPRRATQSAVSDVKQLTESPETTHLSVVDKDGNAVALTTTLEHSYGSGIVVTGGGFLLNNEMGDFNPVDGLTTEGGLIGTEPNLTASGKRMLSSMSPTIVTKDGHLRIVTGSPGGRTIINTVLQTILNVVDHDMNAQQAVDFGRIHHQWLPDRIQHERFQFSPDTLKILKQRGHELYTTDLQGSAQIIIVDQESGWLEAGVDRRRPDAGAAGY